MRILALDQARNGAWSVFEHESGKLVAFGSYSFDSRKYTYSQAVLQIETLLATLVQKYKVSAVFLEDIQLRANVQAFKKLAQLQGVLVNYCEKNDLLYGFIAPSQWQNYCRARGRNAKEIKNKIMELEHTDKKDSKILSMQFVKDQFCIDTDNDNIADAVCIGFYVCEVVRIDSKGR